MFKNVRGLIYQMKHGKIKRFSTLTLLASATILVPLSTSAEETTNSSTETSSSMVEPTATEEKLWQSDFPGGKIGEWQDVIGKTNRELAGESLAISRDAAAGNNAVSLNLDSPKLADGEVETKFKYTAGSGRTGVIIRGNTKDSWVFVGYNANGKWLVESPNSWNDSISGPTLNEDTNYLLKVRYVGEKITIWLNTTLIYEGEPVLANGDKIPTEAGHVGVRLWYDKKIVNYDYFKNGPVDSIPEIVPEVTQIAPVKVFTKIGVAPKLPKQVKVTYNTGKEANEAVSWNEIDPDAYKEPGTFEVDGTLENTNIKAKASIVVAKDNEAEKGDKISSADLTAVVDPQFPRIIRYEDPQSNQVIFNGQHEKIDQVMIDGKAYKATAEKQKSEANQAVYNVAVPEIGLHFTTTLTVSEGQELAMKLSDIREEGTKIHTISIPNQGLISVNSTDEGATFAGVVMNTGTNANNGNKNGDTIQDLTTTSQEETKKYMYGFLNTANYAASFWTNAYGDGSVDGSDNNRIHKQTKEAATGFVTTLSSGAWTYRPFDAPEDYTTGETPEVKVKFSKDSNDDNRVDWQDAAIGFRSIMNNPMGAEKVPELVNQRIPFNFASQATNPFLVTLDESKRIYNLTDGLGQMNLLKGYQNEGHDSAHPDYGAIGQRPGGEQALNQLIDEGHKLNAVFGVHINDTESYPEAKGFNEELVDPTKRGWDWLDPSYFIKQRPDALSGRRYERFKELKQKAPNLDYIYVDVWGNQGESGWASRQLSKEINSLGWFTTNEFPNALEYDSVWNHWSAEKDYGGTTTKGFNSTIVRFIRNHQKDTWIISDNPLLGGAEFEAYEGWVGKTNFNTYRQKTFAINVPTKFLQHYQITNWETTTATDGQIYGTIKLANGAEKVTVTQADANSPRSITLNETEVLKGDAYLLPWNVNGQDKLYHWNPKGGTSTWSLDKKMQGKTNLHLYELTDQGRIDKGAIATTNNQVTIQAEANTPYVIAEPDSIEPMTFGTGTPFKDPGFNEANTLKNNWKVFRGDGEVKKDANGDYVFSSEKERTEIKQDINLPKPGKYSLYLNTETHDRKATVTVKIGGKKYTRTVNNSVAQNYIQADINHTSRKNPQYMQNIRIDFEIPDNAKKGSVTLAVDKGNSVTKFDDLRIVERQTDIMNPDKQTVIKQDFEDTQAVGLYPFVKGSAGGVEDPRIHLSERNEPYTQYGWNGNLVSDVLEGNWSLKAHKQGAGLMLQTIPQNIKFEPNKKYTVQFDYQTDGENVFTAGTINGELKNNNDFKPVGELTSTAADGQTKHYEAEIIGDASGNTTFGIFTTGADKDFIMDNFMVTVESKK